MSEHVPDLNRLPSSLRSLQWRGMGGDLEWHDGDELLLAVPVCLREGMRCRLPEKTDWKYELSVVQIHADEGMLELSCNGDPFGWCLDDADYFVVIRGTGPMKGENEQN